MKRLLQEAVLGTSLDFDGNDLRNVNEMLPVPLNLVDTSDTRLTDKRTPPALSVTNDKVSATAAISQSKLSLDGDIPAEWLADNASLSPAPRAAQGDLVQLSAVKNASNGYAGLDANGRVPSSRLPATGPASGTVTVVKLSLPPVLEVTNGEVIASGSLAAEWQDAPDNSWFGASGVPGAGPPNMPLYQTKLIPDSLMPDIDAAKFTTGLFELDRLPVMKALGVGHAGGLVPDPGIFGDVTDYLARDGSYKTVVQKIIYQPDLTDVQITLQYYDVDGKAVVQLYCPLKGSTIFYQVQSILTPAVLFPYEEAKTNPVVITVSANFTISTYAAKAGYNNSPVNTFLVPPSTT